VKLFEHREFEQVVRRVTDKFRIQGVQSATILQCLLVQFLSRRAKAWRDT
jgi:hypothetical protein